jgi:hypothetical protein
MRKRTVIVASTLALSLQTVTGNVSEPPPDVEYVRHLIDCQAVYDLSPEGAAEVERRLDKLGYEAFPAFREVLKNVSDYRHSWGMQLVVRIDGCNPGSAGDAEIMDLTRIYLRDFVLPGKELMRGASSAIYLAQKGDARDLEVLKQYDELTKRLREVEERGDPPETIYETVYRPEAHGSYHALQARVAGTNLLDSMIPATGYIGLGPFLPSAANTGPQAAYVYDLLKQALAKYGDATNIPPELVTMKVVFGVDGRPVCNIDPARYGLVMPDFAPPPSSPASSPLPDIANFRAAAAQQGMRPVAAEMMTPANAPPVVDPASVPPPRSRFAAPLAAGAGLLAALLLWRGLRKRM